MDQEQLSFAAALESMQQRLNEYFTIERLERDFFGNETKVTCTAYDFDANYFDIELERKARFSIISSRVIAYGPEVSLMVIEVGIGDFDPRGTPRGCEYFCNFRYNHLNVNTHEKILKFPPPAVLTTAFSNSSIDFQVFFWLSHPRDLGTVKREVIAAIHSGFNAEGIEIPYPQQDLHIRRSEIGGKR